MSELHDLIEAQIPRLRRYACALTGKRSAADDLVQDTLERALRKFHLWRSGSDLRAWLFTIMHNAYVNQVRGGAYRRHDELSDEALQVASRTAQADLLDIIDLDAAMRKLPDEQREVLLLVGLEQLTYAETAKVLGIPIGTVMSRLARGRERLHGILGDVSMTSGLKVVK